MGLDMYAHSMPKDETRPPVDFDLQGLYLETTPRIHYWRKHPNLHGWMTSVYRRKGGICDDFNLSTVELLPEDINALERKILDGTLPETNGFFFGESNGEERANDLEFIRKCREEFAKNRSVAYYAWW